MDIDRRCISDEGIGNLVQKGSKLIKAFMQTHSNSMNGDSKRCHPFETFASAQGGAYGPTERRWQHVNHIHFAQRVVAHEVLRAVEARRPRADDAHTIERRRRRAGVPNTRHPL